MRVSVDPVTADPKHALTKEQVLGALSVLPAEWTQSIELVRLSNHLCRYPTVTYSSFLKRLTIYSRGQVLRRVIRDVITELLLHYSMTHPTPLWRLNDTQRKRLNPEVEPLLARALHAIGSAV